MQVDDICLKFEQQPDNLEDTYWIMDPATFHFPVSGQINHMAVYVRLQQEISDRHNVDLDASVRRSLSSQDSSSGNSRRGPPAPHVKIEINEWEKIME